MSPSPPLRRGPSWTEATYREFKFNLNLMRQNTVAGKQGTGSDIRIFGFDLDARYDGIRCKGVPAHMLCTNLLQSSNTWVLLQHDLLKCSSLMVYPVII